MKKLNVSVLIIVVLINFGCNNPNQPIEKYNLYGDPINKKPFLSIDYSAKSESKYIYKTYEFGFFNDSLYPTKFSIYLRNHKIFAELDNPKSHEFILFDFNSKLNSNFKIVIKNYKTIKTFDCVLERRIKTKENLEVNVLRIKKWGKLSDFYGGGDTDLTLFVTEKYGFIGSYFTMKDKNEEIRIGVAGDILREYITYNTQEGILE